MSQYRVGTADFTNGDSTVIGNGTAWLTNLSAGDSMCRDGDGVVYTIAAVTDDTHVELTAAYAGTTRSAQAYTSSRDFTPYYNLYTPTWNDKEWPAHLAQLTINTIDGLLYSLSQENELYRNVVTKTGNYTLQATDSGKLLVMDCTANAYFTLPETSAELVGYIARLGKVGAGDITVYVGGSADVIDNGAVGGEASCSGGNVAYIELVMVAVNQWLITSTRNTWTVT